MVMHDMTGHSFFSWEVVSTAERPDNNKTKGSWWMCRCSCGQKEALNGRMIRASRAKKMCDFCTGKGLASVDGVKTPTYYSWRAMKSRCLVKSDTNYPRYGGSGIGVCNRWKDSFRNFYYDMGERPEGRTLDRIDGKVGYSPENCRWATLKEQARNTTNFKLTDEDVLNIKILVKSGLTQQHVSDMYKVSRSHVGNICRGFSRV